MKNARGSRAFCQTTKSLPHVSGGYPETWIRDFYEDGSSPRKWGLSLAGAGLADQPSHFPHVSGGRSKV